MADVGETAPEGRGRSAGRSSRQGTPPAGVGKAAIVAALVALLIGVAFGFIMSTVGLR